MSQSPSQPVTWPLLGVGFAAGRKLKETVVGKYTVLDLLLAAVTHGERTWTSLASLLAAEWDEEKLEAALRYIDSYVSCVAADGVIDVRSIDGIVRASERGDLFGAWQVDEDPRRLLPKSAIIRRNWGIVSRFGMQRGNYVQPAAHFREVAIPWDREALTQHFSASVKITHGGTRVSFDRGLFEFCLTCLGLHSRMMFPPSFFVRATTGWQEIDAGKGDPVLEAHYNGLRPHGGPGKKLNPPTPDATELACKADAAKRAEEARKEAERQEGARQAMIAEEFRRKKAREEQKKTAEEAAKLALREQQARQPPVRQYAAHARAYRGMFLMLTMLRKRYPAYPDVPCLTTKFSMPVLSLAFPTMSSPKVEMNRLKQAGLAKMLGSSRGHVFVWEMVEREIVEIDDGKPVVEITEAKLASILDALADEIPKAAVDVVSPLKMPKNLNPDGTEKVSKKRSRVEEEGAPPTPLPIPSVVATDAQPPATIDPQPVSTGEESVDMRVSPRVMAVVDVLRRLAALAVRDHGWPADDCMVATAVRTVVASVYGGTRDNVNRRMYDLRQSGVLTAVAEDVYRFPRHWNSAPRAPGKPPVGDLTDTALHALLVKVVGDGSDFEQAKTRVRKALGLSESKSQPTPEPCAVFVKKPEDDVDPRPARPEIDPVLTMSHDALSKLIDARVAAYEEAIRADERRRVTKAYVAEVLREVLPEELIQLVDDAIDAVVARKQSA